MQAIILAGGLGTRISEESVIKPKPMIEIGGRPILWHIMKTYSAHGINDFIICAGYKSYIIKEYFSNYFLHMSDISFNVENNTMKVLRKTGEPWNVTIVDTGESTQTGGRLKLVSRYIKSKKFCFTYGDGLCNINMRQQIKFHTEHGREATITAVQPPGRYGLLDINNTLVTAFHEKPLGDGGWINGGFFILNKSVINRIAGDQTVWEREPLEGLATDKQLVAFKHTGFWQSMDTLRDKIVLENLWTSGKAPWINW